MICTCLIIFTRATWDRSGLGFIQYSIPCEGVLHARSVFVNIWDIDSVWFQGHEIKSLSSRLIGSADAEEGEGAARTGEGVTIPNPSTVEGLPLLDGFGNAWQVQDIYIYRKTFIYTDI